jgi:small conductance mechanosensitive channel
MSAETSGGESTDWVGRLEQLHLLTPLRVLLIIVAAAVLTRVLRGVVNRLLRKALTVPGLVSRADSHRVEARQQALSVALRSALVGAVWAIAVVTAVGELGLNLGAFIATATVIGGAVAFGAQQLMRDLIAGFFVLAEDQYGVGDEVDLGVASGTVERISLRSVRVRDGLGGVWFVPHGGVVRVANLSREPMAVLDLVVARGSSLGALEDEATRLCAALSSDPSVRGQLAGEPRVVGLVDLADDRLVYRLVVATRPGAHVGVQRAWRKLALESFADGRLREP